MTREVPVPRTMRHILCMRCWTELFPLAPAPGRYVGPLESTPSCCHCGGEAPRPIYYRDAPERFACGGVHPQ